MYQESVGRESFSVTMMVTVRLPFLVRSVMMSGHSPVRNTSSKPISEAMQILSGCSAAYAQMAASISLRVTSFPVTMRSARASRASRRTVLFLLK